MRAGFPRQILASHHKEESMILATTTVEDYDRFRAPTVEADVALER